MNPGVLCGTKVKLLKIALVGILMCVMLSAPVFQNEVSALTVNVMDAPYNAAGDGVTNDRAAIQSAIDAVSAAGGGTVNIPGGYTFLSGNLVLKNNVTLNISSGAILKQSGTAAHYTYTPILGHDTTSGIKWDHAFLHNQPFIYAGAGTNNVKVTGTGTIQMTRGSSCNNTIHIVPIGFYKVVGFEISGVKIRNASAYHICTYRCNNGLISGVDIANFSDNNCDGISIMASQDIRVTGCTVNSGDDGIYIVNTYNDPRATDWWRCDDPQPSKNIEIDNNTVNANGHKSFAFIPWGVSCPDPRLVETSNINIHDNVFGSGTSIGCWPDDPYHGNGLNDGVDCSPIKNIRFSNNTCTHPVNFQGAIISDMNLYNNQTSMHNGNFENKGEAYWTTKTYNGSTAGASNSVQGQEGIWYGYIDKLHLGDAKIYQGLTLTSGKEYYFTAKVQSSGATVRLFVRNLDTQALIASLDFNNTAWQTKTLTFTVPSTGNYHVGLERGNATSGWARIDTASVSDISPWEQTIMGTMTPVDFPNNGQYELGTKFKTNVDGVITKVRIYTGSGEGGEHVVRIWRVSDSTCIAGPYTWNITSGTAGWKTFTLPAPLKIYANTDYIVCVSNSTDKWWPRTAYGFNNPINNGNLITYTGSGVYSTTLGTMPTTVSQNNNYFRDVVFVAEQTIMGTMAPVDFPNNGQYELGTKFKTNVDGVITKVRIYTGSGEGGEHVVRIWRVSDSTCIAGPYTWNITSGTAGWKTFTLPAPLNIYANTDYIVCVSNSTDHWWPRTAYGFNNPINNGNLITYTGSGVYSTTLGTMPTMVSQNNNYFRDVVFVALNQN